MQLRSALQERPGRASCPGATAMRDELSHALVEALYELDVLPGNEEAALVGLYAVMDDLREAIRKTEALDRAMARSA
jgi:hypothetical protein